MTFVYFWLVCGLLSFVGYTFHRWNCGKDIKLDELFCFTIWSLTCVRVGLCIIVAVLLDLVDKVIIKGRKR